MHNLNIKPINRSSGSTTRIKYCVLFSCFRHIGYIGIGYFVMTRFVSISQKLLFANDWQRY